NNADQISAGAKPTFKTNIVGGKPVVRFDGVDDFFSLPNSFTGLSAATVLIVVKLTTDPPAAAAQTGLWYFGSSGDKTHFPYTDGTIYDTFGTTVRKTTVDPAPALTSFRVYTVKSSSGNWTSYLDGTQLYTTGSNTVGFTTTPNLASNLDVSAFLQGD